MLWSSSQPNAVNTNIFTFGIRHMYYLCGLADNTKSFGQESENQYCPEEGDGLAGKLGKKLCEAMNKIEKNLTGQLSSCDPNNQSCPRLNERN